MDLIAGSYNTHEEVACFARTCTTVRVRTGLMRSHHFKAKVVGRLFRAITIKGYIVIMEIEWKLQCKVYRPIKSGYIGILEKNFFAVLQNYDWSAAMRVN